MAVWLRVVADDVKYRSVVFEPPKMKEGKSCDATAYVAVTVPTKTETGESVTVPTLTNGDISPCLLSRHYRHTRLAEQVHSKFWEGRISSKKTDKEVTICWNGLLEKKAEDHCWQARLAGLKNLEYEIRVRVTCKKDVSRTKPVGVFLTGTASN